MYLLQDWIKFQELTFRPEPAHPKHIYKGMSVNPNQGAQMLE